MAERLEELANVDSCREETFYALKTSPPWRGELSKLNALRNWGGLLSRFVFLAIRTFTLWCLYGFPEIPNCFCKI